MQKKSASFHNTLVQVIKTVGYTTLTQSNSRGLLLCPKLSCDIFGLFILTDFTCHIFGALSSQICANTLLYFHQLFLSLGKSGVSEWGEVVRQLFWPNVLSKGSSISQNQFLGSSFTQNCPATFIGSSSSTNCPTTVFFFALFVPAAFWKSYRWLWKAGYFVKNL